MSKKCCGFIYSDEDQICRICGNPLVDDDFMSGGTGHMSDMDLLLSSLENKNQDYDEYSYQDNDEQYDDAQSIGYDEAEMDIYEDIPETDGLMPEDEELDTDYSIPNETEQVEEVYTPNETNKMDVLDEIEAEEQAAEQAKIKPGEEKAPTSIKVVGILSIVLAVMALAMAGVFVYFMVINPAYDKGGEASKPLDFPEIATSSDVELTAPRDYISTEPLATSTDYTVYVPVEPEIEEPDATTTDAEVAPEAEVVE